MAVYNEERYLPRVLAALERQTFSDFHLTLLDDGSTDLTREIAARFAQRLSLRLQPSPHRGRHGAKRAAAEAALAQGAPYVLVLDGDLALPPDGLLRMVCALEGDPSAAAVSAHARAPLDRRWGPAQAFLEDLYLRENRGPRGEARGLVGGCMLVRAELLRAATFRGDLPEDSELSEALRARWRLLAPLDLIAEHWGVATSAWGILRRADRDGVRVRSLLRVRPRAWSLGTAARLVPLPLAALALAALLLGAHRLFVCALALLALHPLAFLFASRRVPAPLGQRLAGAFAFSFGALGYGVGFLRESSRGRPAGTMREPTRGP